ncbi:amidohydrolase [Leisingera thetidis]|uniref:amidohydrolase n=1 Tax=Leisingera thetidis TaxID=2930199 RepID=UPI0021F74165|nr:amidohydrolase [Leisingera thetidis]
MTEQHDIARWLIDNSSRFIGVADDIWATPEICFQEIKSSKIQADDLEADGFDITWGAGGLPTAFVASWSNGSGPVIGFIGEYDALPGLSQKIQQSKEALEDGANGHGCGHNLLGTGALASAAALKAWMISTGQTGTLRYYGCPAEEVGFGKVYMARDGAFDDLDAAFNFHPGWSNYPVRGTFLGARSIHYRFKGRASHAGTAPHLGRSALDAVELMNIGTNYLREHVEDYVRLHYQITDGGKSPNIVPDTASVLYLAKSLYPAEVEDLVSRLNDIAKGAALMTGTRFEAEVESGTSCLINNQALADLQYEKMQELGTIDFNEAEMEFAAKINSDYPPGGADFQRRILNLPPASNYAPLIWETYDQVDTGKIHHASTDVAEVGWRTPLCMIRTTCWPLNASPHSWGVVASGGMSIGHKGMMYAATVMALAAAELIENTARLEKVRQEFIETVGSMPYVDPIPPEKMPPV